MCGAKSAKPGGEVIIHWLSRAPHADVDTASYAPLGELTAEQVRGVYRNPPAGRGAGPRHFLAIKYFGNFVDRPVTH